MRKQKIALMVLLSMWITVALAQSKAIFEEGVRAFKAGNYEKAITKLRIFLKKQPPPPEAPEATLFLGRAYKKLGKFSEAEKVFLKAISDYPNSPYIHAFFYELGLIAYELKEPERAIKLLLKGLENCQDVELSMKICFALGDCYISLNNYLAARNFYEEALAKKTSPYEYLKQHPKTYLNVAEIFFIYADYEKAARSFLEIASLYSQARFAPKAWLRAGDALVEMKQFKKALEAYSKVILLYPESEEVWVSKFRMADLGIERPNLKVPVASSYAPYRHPKETYEKLIEKAPLPELKELACYRLAQLLLKEKKYAETVKFLEKYLPIFRQLKEHVIAFMQKALIGWIETAYNKKQYFLVLNLYTKYKSYLDLTNETLLRQVANSYIAFGFYEEALVTYKKISLDTKDLLTLANIYYALGYYPDAYYLLRNFLKTVAEFSQKCEAIKLLAEVNFKWSKYKEALSFYLEFLEQCTPSEPYALYVPIATCYAQIGAYKDAITFLETLFNSAKENEINQQIFKDGHWLLADCYYKVKNYKNALKHYYKLLTLINDEDLVCSIQYQIAKCHKKLGQKEEVINVYKELAEKKDFWGTLAQFALENLYWSQKYQKYFGIFTPQGGTQ